MSFITQVKPSIFILLGLILIYLASLPYSYYYNREKIWQFNTVGEGSDITNTKITEFNEWLGSAQYWNTTIFDFYIPDGVMKLEPL